MTGSHLNGVAVGTGVLSAATWEYPPEMGPIKLLYMPMDRTFLPLISSSLTSLGSGERLGLSLLQTCFIWTGLIMASFPYPGLATVYKAAPDSPVV